MRLVKLNGEYEQLEITKAGVTQVVLEFPEGDVSKHLDIVLAKEGAEAEVLGVYVGVGDQKIMLTVNPIHAVPNTKCLTQIRGVLKDSSSSSFKGLIMIRPGAQKTNSYLDHDVLVIGDKAKNQSEPGLEIEADDVKATHGATTGRVLESHLFYMMSRGLSKTESEKLIVGGFLEPVIAKIKDGQMAEGFRSKVLASLNA